MSKRTLFIVTAALTLLVPGLALAHSPPRPAERPSACCERSGFASRAARGKVRKCCGARAATVVASRAAPRVATAPCCSGGRG